MVTDQYDLYVVFIYVFDFILSYFLCYRANSLNFVLISYFGVYSLRFAISGEETFIAISVSVASGKIKFIFRLPVVVVRTVHDDHG